MKNFRVKRPFFVLFISDSIISLCALALVVMSRFDDQLLT